MGASIRFFPVSKAVSNVRKEVAELIAEIEISDPIW
jgi:hypothetical protein